MEIALTDNNQPFTFTKPANVSQADYLKMCDCMTIIGATMLGMIESDVTGSCGVRVCRSRRDKKFGAVRRIVETDH